ncbi:MAG: hypothetical protein ACREHD_28130 [Pirellulales bacterium]
MAIRIEIRASANHFSRYRKLVDSDWNGRTFADVLQLLWDVVTLSPSRESEPVDWLVSLKKSPNTSPVSMPEELYNVLKVMTGFLRSPYIPQKSNGPAAKKSQLVVQAEATITSLLLQFLCTLTGETGFFRDLQSLLYLNAVHYLLPRLKKTRSTAAFGNLLNALESHSVLMWWNEPSHMFYLRAAMMGQLGRQEERLECLDQALSATPVSDHSYMTKAHAYWVELLETGEQKKALRWLINLSRNVPESYALEVADMIAETAGATVAQN